MTLKAFDRLIRNDPRNPGVVTISSVSHDRVYFKNARGELRDVKLSSVFTDGKVRTRGYSLIQGTERTGAPASKAAINPIDGKPFTPLGAWPSK